MLGAALGGRDTSGGGSDGTLRLSISAASFSSVALRSATKSAMSASKSLSSSSWRDSRVRSRIMVSMYCRFESQNIFTVMIWGV